MEWRFDGITRTSRERPLGLNPDYFLLLATNPLESDCETFTQELARRSWQGGRGSGRAARDNGGRRRRRFPVRIRTLLK